MQQRSSQFSLKALAEFFMVFFLLSCGKPLKTKVPTELKNTLHQGVSINILFDESMTMDFDLLPLKGEVIKGSKFWSGDSWRLKRGSINLRWNSSPKVGFNYPSPTSHEALTYPVEKMKQLSPSEKYDLYMGRYDYPLRWEVDFLARNATAEWEGICHGWAGATINHNDPKPKTMTNPDGIDVYFGSSDIKALLSYAYSKTLIDDKNSLGRRCEENGLLNDSCDDDLTPASFHVVLANKIGMRGQTVIADLDRYKEVWNHPLMSYESVVEKKSAKTGIKTLKIRTKITYLDVVEKNTWSPHPPVTGVMTFRYELDVDSKGNILKGKWLSRERPDFLWTIPRASRFEGYLNGVFDLI